MAFDDIIGGGDGGPDFSAESVLDKVSRAVLPDLPSNTSADLVLNRLNRKLSVRRREPDFGSEEGDKKAPDFSDQGIPLDKLPDFSSEGTPLPEAVPLPRARPPGAPQPPELDAAGQAAALAKGIPHGAIEGTGGAVQGAGTLLATGLGRQAPEGNEFAVNPIPTDAGGNITSAAKAIEASPLVSGGKAIKNAAQTVAPMSAQEQDSILGRVGQSIGGIAPYAAATLLGGPAVGIAAGFTGMAADTYGRVYEEAKNHGADDETAQKAAGRSALVAGALGSLPLGAGKYAQSLIAKVVSSSAAFATAGEAQEAILQQIAKDYDPKAGYSVDQKRIIASLILGAGMGGLHHAFERKPGEPPPDEVRPDVQPDRPEPTDADFHEIHGLPRPDEPPPPPGGDRGPGPNPDTGGPGNSGTGSQNSGSGARSGPPPGSGTGKAGEAGFTMDPQTRAKMERVYRHFERGKDPSGMTDGELYDAVNEHLRDTSSTGHTAKEDTAEEKAQRDAHATKRDEDAELKSAFAWMTDAQVASMTPKMREVWLGRARKQQAGSEQATSKPQAESGENPSRPEAAAPDQMQREDVSASDFKNEPQNAISAEGENVAAGTRDAPIRPKTADDVVAAQPAEPKSDAQAEAENYKHAHMELEQFGLTGANSISIETGVGQERSGLRPDGTRWSVVLKHGAYGRIKGTKGADGQPLDIMVGPHPTSPHIFVVDQHDPATGKFDEHKIFAGYRTPIDALHAYANSYDDGARDRIGHVTAMGPDEFRAWRAGDTTKALKPASAEPVKAADAGQASTEAHTGQGGVPKETPAAVSGARSGDRSGPTIPEAGKSSARQATPVRNSEHPLSLLQFIASKGGVAPHPELEAIGLTGKHRVQIPGRSGFFGVVRPGGVHHDRMREAAEEAGYFRGTNGTSTPKDFLDAADAELRGNEKHAEGEEGTTSKRQKQAAAEREAHDKERHEIEYGEATANLIDAGYVGTHTDLHEAAVKLMVDEGLSPDDAIDRAALRLLSDDPDYLRVTPNAIKDTFGGGAYDEIRAGPVSANGERAPREREGGARPREGEEDRGDGEHLPSTGEARSQAEGGRTAQLHASDADEVVDVRLTPKGPWDFNDTWPEPKRSVLEALETEGRNPFDSTEPDVESVVGMLDEGMYAMMSAVSEVRGIDQRIADLRSGKTKLKKNQTLADALRPLQRDRGIFAAEVRDTAAAHEDIFGREASFAMIKEARARLRQEEAQNPVRATRPPTDVIEEALGSDAELVAPVDIARAAEIMDENPDIPPGVAFGHAVIENAVDQGYTTEQEAEKAYGPEVKTVLEPEREGPSGSGSAVEQGGSKPDEVGTGNPAEAGVVPSGGKTRRKGKRTSAGARAGNEAAGATDAAEQQPASRKRAAGDEASNAAENQPAAEDAGNAVDKQDYIDSAVRAIVGNTQGGHEAVQAAIDRGAADSELIQIASERGWGGSYGGNSIDRGAVEGRGKVVTITLSPFGKIELKGASLADAIRSAFPQSVDGFIAGIEREIAKGKYNADIAPTRSVEEFKAAAEARGWTYGAYGKGKALWSPDQKHTMLFHVPVEGNHLNVQWGTPYEGVEPPGAPKTKVEQTIARSREAADRTNKREDARHAEQIIKDDLPKGTKLVEKDGKFALEVDGKVQSGYREYQVDAIKDYRRQQRDAPTWAEVLAELPMRKDGRTREHEIAFAIMTEITGKKKANFAKLTPEQKHELLDRVKAKPEAIERNLDAAKSLMAEQAQASGDPRAEAKVREKLRALANKTPITDEKTVAAIDIAATRLDMGDGRKKGLEFAKPVSTPTASWVIKDKATGEVVMETFDKKKVDALNTEKYEAVPIQEHLAGLNKKAAEPDPFDDIFDKAVEEQFAKPTFDEMLAEQKAKQAPARKLVEDAIASGKPKLVLEKGARKLVFSSGFDGTPYRVTSFDEQGPVGHRDYGSGENDVRQIVGEVYHALRDGFAPRVEPTTETGADNKPQMVMPGAEKAPDKTMAQRGADARLKPKVAQKSADIGLFGDDSKQADMMDLLATPAKKASDLSLDDVSAGLGKLFGKGLAESEVEFFDEAKYQQALPFFKAGISHFSGADLPTTVRALVKHLAGAGMDAEAIRAMKPYIKRFTDDVTAGRETTNAPSRGDVLEPDRGEPKAGNRVGETDVSAAAGATGQGAGERGGEAHAGDERPGGGVGLPQDHAPVVGEHGNLELPAREPVDEDRDAANRDRAGSAPGGEEGFSFDDGADDEAVRNAQKDADVNARRERQRQAEGVEVIDGDIGNIAETLPMLHPEQHGDVKAAEERYSKPDGHGMLFTNGTGTGKTYSGLGVIKRFTKKGQRQILVVAPSQGILLDWVRSAKDLGLDMNVLESTADKGRPGLNATTYANLGDNPTLADHDWHLVVADEAHKLSSDQDGTTTKALEAFRALTKHPDGMRRRAQMVLRRDWAEVEKLKPTTKHANVSANSAMAAAIDAFEKKAAPLIEKWKTEARPKALMMSATPFAYHFSLDYANGYLFEFGADKNPGAYNAPTGRDSFYMQHLGYRKRTGKLTKPDADVKQEIMERQLHEYLKKTGSLHGRALTVDKDYDRKFVLAHNAAGELIDRALNFLQEAEGGRYRPLHEIISKQFDYLARMRLLEAMKAQDAVDYIKESHALGRKVVVFHDYNEGGGISPFTQRPPSGVKVTSYVGGKHVEVELAALYDDFARQNPYIKELDFAAYPPPIQTLSQAFPNALLYNGNVSVKNRNEAKRLFNDDNSGRDLIVVQSAAGEAGISLHDTTGKHQRTILNLGMPIRPTTSIQQEGRIYRVGQSSDALFRYMNTGTDWERWTFAGKIADRAGTAENLALGNLARTIRQSFIDAFSNAGDYRPEPGEGKGGKDLDRATTESISEFEKAKTHYFAQAKTSGRRDQREGKDYYATPEPIGLKMVEFAGLKPGEKILEPSAGHGAIARYFPEDSARTLVEPSSSLASRAALTSPGARVVVDNFENLDVGANKFDAIVMNPPFGTGGKTAIDHLEKAGKHLRNGGRIVALIPQGASTDKRFDAYMDSPATKGIYIVGDIKLPPVTFERAGTSINTRIVVLEKQTDPEIAQKLQQKSRDYSDVEKIGDLFDRIENADMGERLEPKTKDVDAPIDGGITIDGVELKLNGESNGTVYADLKNKLGIDKFKQVMRAAEANGGHYLKTIKSIQFPNAAARQKFLDALANPPAAPEQPKAPSGVTFKSGETIHAKTGDKLFVASPEQRVERDVYDQMAAAAKANGGYYSSFKGRGAIPGFQFKSDEARKAFLKQVGGGGLGESVAQPAAGQAGQQWTLTEGRKTGLEHLVVYGTSGKEIGREIGTENFVHWPAEVQARLEDPTADMVAHHNHPSNQGPSPLDIAMTGNKGLRAMYAHGHGGNVYRVEMLPEYKATLPADWRQMIPLVKNLIKRIEDRLTPLIQDAVNKHLVSGTEASMAFNHLTSVVMRDAGLVHYDTNIDIGDFIERVPVLAKAMVSAADVAQREAFGGKRIARTNDRRANPVRHAGDVGTVFDKAALATVVGDSKSVDRARSRNNREEEGGLSAPNNTFKAQGSTDTSLGEVLRTRLLGKLGDLNATEAKVHLQDKFARVKNAEESVGAPTNLSAYQAESLYYGRTGQRLESLNEHHIDPIIREMKGRDISLDKLDEFLYARHAPERNNKIGAMHPPGHEFYEAMTDYNKVGGSGWSTNEALGVIRSIRAAGKLNDYLAVARMIDGLNFRTRQTLFNAGLIDRDTFDAWNTGYKYYVPLRGHAEGDQFMSFGSGMNVRGKEAKQAFGRRSKAESPTAYSIMQAEAAVVRAEKNKVGNTFLQFVRANPDPRRWTVDRPPLVKRVDPTTGLVTTVPDNLYANRDNVFTTKVNGKDVHVTMHGPDGLNLARALKNMGSANVHRLIRLYSTVTHTMAKLATSINPDFMIPNLVRDFGEAVLNLTAQQQRGFVSNFIKHLPGAMKGSMQALAGGGGNHPPGSPPRRYIDAFHEFDAAGGRIRFFGIDDPDQIERNAERKLKRLDGGPVNTIKDIGDKAAKALEVAGGGLENATRLAAYMAARDAGFSIDDAAMMARNLTVDFNKKGELGGAISALYMFANAGIQGQARMVKAMGSRRVWAAVGALAAAAALSTLYSILGGNTDEAGVPDYMKIPPWERDKNLIFMTPSGYYAKVPLPYGFSPFAVVGSRVMAVMMGHEKPGNAAAAVIDSVINAFNPLGEEASMWMDLVPSAIRPAFHIQFNKNWTGKPLYPEQDRNRGSRPDSTQGFKSDSAFSKEAARLLNEWSGGTQYKRGVIDVHPGSIDHVLQAIGGGVGRFAKSVADTAYNGIKGGEWEPDKTPILRRFVGKVDEKNDTNLYYEKRQEVKDLEANVTAANKDLNAGINIEQANKAIAEGGDGQKQIFNSADAQMKDLRAQMREIENSAAPYDKKQADIAGVKAQMRSVMNSARADSVRLKQGAK